jgi:hypothetical protein
MKPLQTRTRQLERQTRMQLVIEKDCALAYILAGIASQSSLPFGLWRRLHLR